MCSGHVIVLLLLLLLIFGAVRDAIVRVHVSGISHSVTIQRAVNSISPAAASACCVAVVAAIIFACRMPR